LKPGDKNEVTITNDYNVRANYVRLYVAPDEEASNHDIVIVEPQKGAYPKEHLKVGDKDYTYMGSTTVIDGIVGKGGVTVRVESQRTEWHPTYVKQPASILGAEHDALLRSVIGGSDQRPSSRSQYISDSPLYAPDRLRDIGSRPPSGSRRKFEE